MLSITRKNGQSFHIGDDIVVTLKRSSTGSAVIAIQAPENVRILRTELIDSPYLPLAEVKFLD